jgi:hypothetical protein
MKRFIKSHPFISFFISIGLVALIIYIYFLFLVFRPLNLVYGRMKSSDKTWNEIKFNITKVKLGSSKSFVLKSIGTPDTKFYHDSSQVWTYEEYGVIAPGLVYEIEFHSDTVIRIENYRW